MNFIIPQNYRFKKKILGIIDYSTATFNIIWNVIIYVILRNINTNFSVKLFIFSTLSFPILLLTIVGFNNESPLYTIKYFFKYLFSQKVYLFRKSKNYLFM